ncbi:hypothetical protein E4U41_006765 [Claviceps citrina]|nr:hypothetical protein E4U41_006765 [Claviceps citrina]
MAPTTFLVRVNDARAIAHPRNAAYLGEWRTSYGQDPDADHESTDGDALRFTTEHVPGEPSDGFVFGTDPDSCDILLQLPGAGSISRRQFAIAFDPVTRATRLRNLSIHGTPLSHPKGLCFNAQDISPTDKIAVELPGLVIKLFSVREDGYEAEYDAFFNRLALSAPNLGRLRLQSSTHVTAITAMTNATDLAPDLYFGNQLGEGSSGVICSASLKKNGQGVAIKRFHDKINLNKITAWMERSLHRPFKHDHVIAFQELRLSVSSGARLIMERAKGGDMLTQCQKEMFSFRDFKIILRQVLQGLSYLHGEGVIHRDLKPGHILFMDRNPILVKITGFDESTFGPESSEPFGGSARYAAPEMHQPPYTNKVDIWSVGAIAVDFCLGLPNHETVPTDSWINTVVAKASAAQGSLGDFLRSTLSKNPDDRKTAAQCLELKFLNELAEQPAPLSDVCPVGAQEPTASSSPVNYPSPSAFIYQRKQNTGFTLDQVDEMDECEDDPALVEEEEVAGVEAPLATAKGNH